MPQVNPIIRRDLQDKALKLLTEGKSTKVILSELGVSKDAYYAWRKLLAKSDETRTLRQNVSRKISRENAFGELSKQTEEATTRYDDAIGRYKATLDPSDEKAAMLWSQACRELLKEWLRVTGAYEMVANTNPEPVEITIVKECPKCKAQEIVDITQQSACKS